MNDVTIRTPNGDIIIMAQCKGAHVVRGSGAEL